MIDKLYESQTMDTSSANKLLFLMNHTLLNLNTA